MKIGCFIIFLVSCGTALATDRYVSTNSPGPVSPFTSWETAATNIQNAIDASGVGDVVWVSNGVYNTGSSSGYRVNITKTITVRSVNGPANTIIQGQASSNILCVYLVNNSTLIGFTTTGGGYDPSVQAFGGGVHGQTTNTVVSNCIVSGNSTRFGGGAYFVTMYNCLIISNSASVNGGGVRDCVLYNCTLAYNGNAGCDGGGGITYAADGLLLYNCLVYGNYAWYGAGVYGAKLYNCTIAGNSSGSSGGGTFNSDRWNCVSWSNNAADSGGTAHYSCGQGLAAGDNNISINPKFITAGNGYGASHIPGNYRLQADSPCIDKGTNQAWMSGAADLDGRNRIDYFRRRVDMGAYEFLSSGFMTTFR